MKRRSLHSILITMVCAIASHAAAPGDGLILYYPFTADSLDASGSGNHGHIFGAQLASDHFARLNCAYYFNGQGAYIQSEKALPDSDSITVTVWLKLDTWATVFLVPQVVFFEGDDGSGHDLVLALGNGVIFNVKSDASVMIKDWMPPVGVWTHIACVAQANASMAIWVNGHKTAEAPFTNGANVGYHSPFNLGRRPGGYNDWFLNGSIDEVRVYNRALSDAEIGQLYSAESGSARLLKVSVDTIRVAMNLNPGDRYILQSSNDLQNWTDFGTAFVATSAEQTVSIQLDEHQNFWRVLSAP